MVEPYCKLARAFWGSERMASAAKRVVSMGRVSESTKPAAKETRSGCDKVLAIKTVAIGSPGAQVALWLRPL